jgi:hypothetical protein
MRIRCFSDRCDLSRDRIAVDVRDLPEQPSMEHELGGDSLRRLHAVRDRLGHQTFTSQVNYSQIGDYDLALRDRLQIPSLNPRAGFLHQLGNFESREILFAESL